MHITSLHSYSVNVVQYPFLNTAIYIILQSMQNYKSNIQFTEVSHFWGGLWHFVTSLSQRHHWMSAWHACFGWHSSNQSADCSSSRNSAQTCENRVTCLCGIRSTHSDVGMVV